MVSRSTTNLLEKTVIPLPKKNKPPSRPASYRPISLTSTLCKLLEKVDGTRMRWFLEGSYLLNPSQSGLRKGRSYSDQIVRLAHDITAFSTQSKMTKAVFLDLEKAFDMVWRDGIIL